MGIVEWLVGGWLALCLGTTIWDTYRRAGFGLWAVTALVGVSVLLHGCGGYTLVKRDAPPVEDIVASDLAICAQIGADHAERLRDITLDSLQPAVLGYAAGQRRAECMVGFRYKREDFGF